MLRVPALVVLFACLTVGTVPVGARADVTPEPPATTPPVKRDTEEEPRTVALLILAEAASGYALSEVYGAARRPLETHTALRVAPLEAIGLDERNAALRTCAGDAACFIRRLEAARGDVDLLLAVSIDRPGDVLLLGLRLIDTRRGREVGATGDEIPLGMSLEGALAEKLPEVFPSSIWGRVAGVRIDSVPPAAEALVAGRSCVTPCAFDRLAPGAYELRVRQRGKDVWRTQLQLESGKTAFVRADLREEATPLLESPWLWTAVGLAAVGAAVGTFLLVQSSDPETILCFSSSPTACDRL